jgi:hypothetical protein
MHSPSHTYRDDSYLLVSALFPDVTLCHVRNGSHTIGETVWSIFHVHIHVSLGVYR